MINFHIIILICASLTNYVRRRGNTGDCKCTMPPWLCKSMWPQHPLQIFAAHNELDKDVITVFLLYKNNFIANSVGFDEVLMCSVSRFNDILGSFLKVLLHIICGCTQILGFITNLKWFNIAFNKLCGLKWVWLWNKYNQLNVLHMKHNFLI